VERALIKLRRERRDSLLNLVARRSDLLDSPPLRVGEVPVDAALARGSARLENSLWKLDAAGEDFEAQDERADPVRDVLRAHGDAAVAHFVDEARADPAVLRRLRALLAQDA